MARTLLRSRHTSTSLDPSPDEPGRRGLVLAAACTLFDEAPLGDLPWLARLELQRGASGPLRQSLARLERDDVVEVDEVAVARLRDEVVLRVSGATGGRGALMTVDQVHLRRVFLGVVPPIIGAGCLLWYGLHRSIEGVPFAAEVRTLQRSYESWVARPLDRPVIEEQMREVAVTVVGRQPSDLLDVEV